MKINFFKMQAQGNDYIYCALWENDKSFLLNYASEIAERLSKRRFAVGSDGLVLIDKSNIADCKIIIYNSDGSVAKTCGNALRCVGFFMSNKLSSKKISIETQAGIFDTETNKNMVSVNMGEPRTLDVDIDCNYDKRICSYLKKVTSYSFVNVGNDHLVIYDKRAKTADNGLIGAHLCNYKCVFDGINVEFVQIKDGKIYAEVYERGSGKTACCGSGSAAVYYALKKSGFIKKRAAEINFEGGKVFCESRGENIIIKGKVDYCFSGVVNYD